MSLHGSLDEQSVLVTAVVVVVNIVFNRGNELFSACKSMPIIALTLQDSPEAFHRAVVNAAANTGHTLCHPGIQQFLVEGSAGVLESTVAVEQRVCIRIFQNSFIKRVKKQLVVISVTNNIADDSPVTQIENRTQIELVDNWTFIPLELRYIGQSLFVGIPQKPSIGPLSMQRPTRDILCVIPASSSFLWKVLLVYWNPRSLWNSGCAFGFSRTALSSVSKNSLLSFRSRIT